MASPMPSPQFIQDLHRFACRHGSSKPGFVNGTLICSAMHLNTEHTEILVNPQTQALEVRAKSNLNPVLMVTDDGNVLRYHGEFQRVSTHLCSLLTPPETV